jgi:hypothetical protein
VSTALVDLATGPLYRFADWPNPAVPNWRAGVYTVWDGDVLIYVGMAGRGMPANAHHGEAALSSRKPKGLRDRLGSHAGGRRSGDQFNIYVFDRLVLPSLSADDIRSAADGKLSLDLETRRYIRDRLSYRFVITDDGTTALALEREIQRGAISNQTPKLNPRG